MDQMNANKQLNQILLKTRQSHEAGVVFICTLVAMVRTRHLQLVEYCCQRRVNAELGNDTPPS
jgi:hypothetical protein